MYNSTEMGSGQFQRCYTTTIIQHNNNNYPTVYPTARIKILQVFKKIPINFMDCSDFI